MLKTKNTQQDIERKFAILETRLRRSPARREWDSLPGISVYCILKLYGSRLENI